MIGFIIWPFLGFEHPKMACCGFGGPPLNYNSEVPCGETKNIDGNEITSGVCKNPNSYINWDGNHHTEAANSHVASKILSGQFSEEYYNQ